MRQAFLIVILGLAALGGVGFVCVEQAIPAVEAALQHEAERLLPPAARDWAVVEVEGRALRLEGTAPSSEERDEALGALAMVRDARAVVDATASAPSVEPVQESPSDAGLALICQREIDELLANERIHFEVLSAAISPASQPLLARLADALSRCPEASIEIAGHTDGEGIEDLNQKLSEARAQSVRNSLIARGVSRERLRAVGYGSTRPVADDSTEQGRMENRRIEFTVKATRS